MPSFDYSQFLTQAAADARYQALGSLGSSTPTAETPDHAGSAGVSSSAARQDHVHPITTGAPTAVKLSGSNTEGFGTGFARDTHEHVVESVAWTAWTPTLTNLTLGNGTLTASYQKIGRTVHYRFKLILGSTSAVGSDPRFSFPVAVASDYTAVADAAAIGMVHQQDLGGSSRIGMVWLAAGEGRIISYSTTGGAIVTTSTVPFTWGTGDSIFAWGTYEAAS